MIAVLKNGTTAVQRENLIKWLTSQGLQVHVSEGEYKTVLGLIGDTAKLDIDLLAGLDIVDQVTRITEPFKNANRKFRPEDSVITLDTPDRAVSVGGGAFALIAGPGSVENEEQICSVAVAVKAAGATMLRGGAFNPRTSPYDFQGLGADAIKYLLKAKQATGLPIVSELLSIEQLDLFADVDVIQVGSRNMQNFELLKELGHCNKPVLLKRGLCATLKELLMSAEYIMTGGNDNVILCERGIRSYDTYTRDLLDLSAVPLLKELSHLPVIVDPSHATGASKLVRPMALAATAAGADGLMIEVHNDPLHALCNGALSLTPDQFADLAVSVKAIRSAM